MHLYRVKLLALFCGLWLGFVGVIGVYAQNQNRSGNNITILELNGQIKDKKSQIQSLKKQIAAYEQSIKQRQSQTVSLENEAALLEDQIAKFQLSIEASEEEIIQLDLEIAHIELEIIGKESEIVIHKERLSQFLQQMYEQSERGYLEALLLNDRFSDFFDHIAYLEQAQSHVAESLSRIMILRDELEVQRQTLLQNKQRQEQLRSELTIQKDGISERKEAKEQLIIQSLVSKNKFEQLLRQARDEQSEINSEVQRLEETVRTKLKLSGKGSVVLMWPVDPSRGLSAYFQDPDYPFRHLFEHAAIDIRAYQGTYVRAAEDGYVGRAKDAGRGYSYIMLLHDKGISTVYGHVSRIMAEQDSYVKKGQIIGLSGGTPGTGGAGNFTTGPHLHFEVRVNGIPDNPLKFLP